jgi:hypothetical protein
MWCLQSQTLCAGLWMIFKGGPFLRALSGSHLEASSIPGTVKLSGLPGKAGGLPRVVIGNSDVFQEAIQVDNAGWIS